MFKSFVKLSFTAINVNFKQTDILYGIPSPLAYQSLLKALEFRLPKLSIIPGFMLSYRNSYQNKEKDFSFIQRGCDNGSGGLVDIPRGSVSVDIIFQIESNHYTISNISHSIRAALLKMRLSGGVFVNNSIKLKFEPDISNIKRSLGFTQYSSDKEYSSGTELLYDSLVAGSPIKGIFAPSVVGYIKLGEAGIENSIYNKEHFFAEPSIQMTKFKFIRELDLNTFYQYAWFSQESDHSIQIKTGVTNVN